MLTRIAVALSLLLALALPAKASVCTVTDFSASGILTAARFNDRFNQVENCFLAIPTFPLAVSQLSNKNAIYSQSWSVNGADDGVPGDGITAQVGVRQWMVPVTSTIIGVSVRLSGCTGCSVNVTFKANGSTYKSFVGIAGGITQTDYTISTSVTNIQDMTIDIAGTFTGVKTIDMVVYLKAQHQT